MSKKKCSAVHTDTGLVNPYQARVRGLFDQKSVLREMAALIHQTAVKNPSWSRAQIKRHVEGLGVKEKFLTLLRNAESATEESPFMPRPPPSSVLYGRFAKSNAVLDLGSGNGMRLVPLIRRGHDIHASDSGKSGKQIERTLKVKFTRADAMSMLSDACFDRRLISSFLSLTQFTALELSLVRNRDGIHLVPDPEYQSRCRQFYEGKERASEVSLRWGGLIVGTGYRLVATFAPSSFEVNLVGVGLGTECARALAAPLDLSEFNYEDCSLKADGKFCAFESGQGQVCLYDRAGYYSEAFVNLPPMMLELEDMGTFYVLLRIVHYRGMFPPHCLDTLEEFVKKVKMKINGKKIYCPVRWMAGLSNDGNAVVIQDGDHEHQYLFDGLICRIHEKDYYCKKIWTVDMYPSTTIDATFALRDHGWTSEIPVRYDHLAEYEMEIDDGAGHVKFKFKKPRLDKCEATKMSTIVHLLTTRTLSGLGMLTAVTTRTGNCVYDIISRTTNGNQVLKIKV